MRAGRRTYTSQLTYDGAELEPDDYNRPVHQVRVRFLDANLGSLYLKGNRYGVFYAQRSATKSLPQALKHLHIFDGIAARLKSGPPQNLLQSYFFRGLLEDVRCRFAMRIYGYVVMPAHLHLLVNEPEGAALADARS